MIFYRSLMIHGNKRNLKILERLAEKGYLPNTRQFEGFEYHLLHISLLLTSSLVPIICSMKNLEKLTLNAYYVKLSELAPVFQSCSELSELNILANGLKMDEMGEVLVDQLRSGFRRLRQLDVACSINKDLWPGIQEMLT